MIHFCRKFRGLEDEQNVYIEQIANMLIIDLNDPAITHVRKAPSTELQEIVNSFSTFSKEWFVMCLYGISNLCWDSEDENWNLFYSVIRKSGLDADEFETLVMRTKANHQLFTLIMRQF